MPNSNRQQSIKSPKRFKNHVSNYNKRQMLTMLKQSNCNSKELLTMVARFKVDENLIKRKYLNCLLTCGEQKINKSISKMVLEFINEQADAAQSRMEQTLKSQYNKHFMNLDECAKNLISEPECATDNTLPVTLEAIANLEEHPPPSELNGIDLKVLYQTLANMTAGYPVNDIEDGPTKEFLKHCYMVNITRY